MMVTLLGLLRLTGENVFKGTRQSCFVSNTICRMKINRRRAAAVVFASAAAAQSSETTVTHGPFLGHISLNEVHIWARTGRSGSFRIEYGLSPGKLTRLRPQPQPHQTTTTPLGSVSRACNQARAITTASLEQALQTAPAPSSPFLLLTLTATQRPIHAASSISASNSDPAPTSYTAVLKAPPYPPTKPCASSTARRSSSRS